SGADELDPDPLVAEEDDRALAERDEVDGQRQDDDRDGGLGLVPLAHRSSSSSRPMVSPGRPAASRTPSSTPGAKEDRSSESCRMVSVSPSVPSRTSWWATSPARRIECTRTPSTSAPRAPSSATVVASGLGPAPASSRALAI